MSAKHELQKSIQEILFNSREGSFATRADRKAHLMKFAEDLVKLGYKLRHVQGLKSKHICAVTQQWKSAGLTSGTMKNRTSALRYLVKKIGKSNIVPDNTALSIPARKYVPQFNRAIFNPDFSLVTNPYVLASLQLQKAFGLRREESIKIRPHQAEQGDTLILQPSWCKGKRGRNIPIHTEEQRCALEQAKALVKKGDSLIPVGTNYIRHRQVYSKHIAKAGLGKLHGLRHAFAQIRYKELTGWDAPINGGPKSKDLTPDQKEIDHEARMMLSTLLGHERESITVNYLGR